MLTLASLLPERGLTFHITGVWQYGTNLDSQYIYTLVKPSSMSSDHYVRLDSYWAQQYMFHHKVAVRLGQIAAGTLTATPNMARLL